MISAQAHLGGCMPLYHKLLFIRAQNSPSPKYLAPPTNCLHVFLLFSSVEHFIASREEALVVRSPVSLPFAV